MRSPVARTVPAVAACLLLGSVALAQSPETKFWPLASISFPIDVAKLNALNPKPVAVRFYAAPPKGKFEEKFRRKPSELDEILDTTDRTAPPKRGFTYKSAADGVEEFAVQYEFADGTFNPPTNKLAPDFRVHFDTRPPSVKASATTGASSIRWKVTDDNLVDDSVRVEGRMIGETDWQFLNTGDLKADDSFRWRVPANKTLEVRVYARDRAGHESRSAPIKLAGDGAKAEPGDPLKAPKPAPGSFGDPKPPVIGRTGFGGADDLPGGNPKIEYVSTNKLTVKNKITHITRSGVTAAQLYVQEPGTNEWRAASKKDKLTITTDSADADRVVGIEYDAPRDGLYGFVVQPISGAGTKLDDPRTGDTPQYLVQVDTTPPEMVLKRVGVSGSGLNGPLVEIEWEAKDNFSFPPEPIVLEYSDDGGTTWKAIAAKTGNQTGRYTWEITDKKLWKFLVRGSATDMAGNTKLVTYNDEKNQPLPVLVDLDKPSGAVEKVNPNGKPSIPPGGKPVGVEPRIDGAAGVQPAPFPTVPVSKPETPPVPKPVPDAPKPVVAPPKPVEVPKVEGPAIPKLPDTPPPVPVVPPKKDEPRKEIDADLPVVLPLPPPVTLPELPK